LDKVLPLHFYFETFETFWDSLPPKWEFIIGIPRTFHFHSPNMFKPFYCLSLLLVPISFCLVSVLAMNSMLWEKNNQFFDKSCKSPQGWALMDESYLHALKNSHEHQHLLVILFHNCYHVIPSYIFHYTLKAFETRIWLKNTHVVCNCKIEIHNKCKKKRSNTPITSTPF
jgi:hypothetical protein